MVQAKQIFFFLKCSKMAEAKSTTPNSPGPTFIGDLCHFQPFFLFFNFFKHFFEHIKGPLWGLFYRTDECSSGDLRGGAFSIRLQNCKVIS